MASRARIVLACADGLADWDVARECGVSVQTVAKWRRRFLREGVDGLADRPRSGAPRSVGEDVVATVVDLTLHETPPGGGRWSKRTLARRAGVSASTVARIWAEHGIVPRAGTAGAVPVRPVRTELAGVYLNALLAVFALRAGSEECRRNLANRFSRPRDTARVRDAVAAVPGVVPGADHQVAVRDGTPRLGGFLRQVEALTAPGLDLHLICDAQGAQGTVGLLRWQREHPRFHLHFTPDRGLWLKLIMSELIEEERRQRAGDEAVRGIREWCGGRGAAPFVWYREV